MTALIPAPSPEIPDLSQITALINSIDPPAVTSGTGRISESAAALLVTDNAKLAEAKTLLLETRRNKKAIEAWAEPYKSFLNGAKSSFMDRLKGFLSPLDAADTSLAAGIRAYEDKVKAEVAAERKRLEEEAKAQAESAAPWEEAIAIPTPPLPVVALPVVSGVGSRKLPPKAVVSDPRAFLTAALQKGNERMLEFVTFNGPALNAEAKRMGRLIESTYPGVTFVQEETISTR